MGINYNWVQEGIINRQTLFMATGPTYSALRSAESGWGTVFSQEIGQLERHGYQRGGSYYYPGSSSGGQQYFNGLDASYNFYNDIFLSDFSAFGGDDGIDHYSNGSGYSFQW